MTLVVSLLGCGPAAEVHFRLDMQGRDPALFDASKKDNAERVKRRGQIATALYAMFGTPDDPFVFPESGLDLYKIKLAAGRVSSDQHGEQRGLYRQHCAHCHGITGDGAGPTAAFLNPYPRDYRKGVYKFKSTELANKPTHEDLHRILREGINGTAMPSFVLLPQQERDALVEYVKYLSMRGEVEALLAGTAYEADEDLDMTHAFLVGDILKSIASNWEQSDTMQITVPDHPKVDDPAKWLATGAELFRGPKAQCTKCHGPTGLGDGSDENLFDEWNKEKKQEITRKEIAALRADGSSDAAKQIAAKEHQLWVSTHTYLLPEQKLLPRNLRMGLYRFGRSPADTYRRVHAGIAGTPMPAGGKTLKPDEIWAIVDYVRTLPYQSHAVPQGNTLTLDKPRN